MTYYAKPLDHAPKIHVTPIATVRFQGITHTFQRCSNAFKMQAASSTANGCKIRS